MDNQTGSSITKMHRCEVDVIQLRTSNADEAFKKLFNHFWAALFQFSFNLLRNDDDAQDAVQEVFVSLWNRRYDIDIQTSLQAYLFTSVRYKSLTKLTKRLEAHERNVPLENLIENSFQQFVDPLIIKELQAEIEVQIEKLPERMKAVIQLKAKDALSITEIATQLNISEDTVKNHLAAARKKLRIELSDMAYVSLLILLGTGS
ncbi:sigma-70 family RNA polymerase sigma factor [Sphingobacterium olei]|uniref:Sigma-70 family RNA polymerase sigma factor n=1 Tax=Sphingobacterium olei TaxID=2571155 RepID=A0A4U0P0H2_9SPHI|nr:sigma-70 family RNA polymerase sigma factor [Sphingobacterium olei]TJZ60002.1 sigma-70 family RNA polymerase sigma factor [Sphingobacterium olei]